MPEAPDIATAWRNQLEQTPHARHGGLLMAQATYEQPRLRALYPFYSHGAWHFLRTVPPPWPHDLGEPELPFITEGGPPYRVYTARYELLGEAVTPQDAAALLVAYLPPGVGQSSE